MASGSRALLVRAQVSRRLGEPAIHNLALSIRVSRSAAVVGYHAMETAQGQQCICRRKVPQGCLQRLTRLLGELSSLAHSW